jgi:hypothetical protein
MHILFGYFIGFTGMYAIYEIGYIINDAYTTYYEKDPTLHIESKELSFLREKLLFIITVKLITTFMCCVILYLMRFHNIVYFIISLFFLFIFYLLHNSIRSDLNVLTFFLINLFKYLSVILIFFPSFIEFKIIVLISFLIPIPRSLAYTSKERIHLKYKVKDIDVCQIIYYSILTVIVGIISLFGYIKLYWVIMYGYFFLFRILTYFYKIIIRPARQANINK